MTHWLTHSQTLAAVSLANIFTPALNAASYNEQWRYLYTYILKSKFVDEWQSSEVGKRGGNSSERVLCTGLSLVVFQGVDWLVHRCHTFHLFRIILQNSLTKKLQLWHVVYMHVVGIRGDEILAVLWYLAVSFLLFVCLLFCFVLLIFFTLRKIYRIVWRFVKY